MSVRSPLTVQDAGNLLRAVSPSVMEACAGMLDPLVHTVGQDRMALLDVGTLNAVWPLLPIILGQPEPAPDIRDAVVHRWIAAGLALDQFVGEIAMRHPVGQSLLTCDQAAMTAWVPRRLLSWFADCPQRTNHTRWILTPEYPVPVMQVLLVGMQANIHPLVQGDIRPPMVADTLADLRLKAAGLAMRWAYTAQTVQEIAALGGFDGLLAAALLLNRGGTPAAGWTEARETFSIAPTPGWAGCIQARFGKVDREFARTPPAVYAWMTTDFEESDQSHPRQFTSAAASSRPHPARVDLA